MILGRSGGREKDEMREVEERGQDIERWTEREELGRREKDCMNAWERWKREAR